jgi:hypothetical protein
MLLIERLAPQPTRGSNMIRKTLACLSVAAIGFVSSTALAADEPATTAAAVPSGEKESGVELGARTGFGLPLGEASKDNKMSDGFTGHVPIQLDVGYRFTRNIYAGGYFMYGLGLTTGARCSD